MIRRTGKGGSGKNLGYADADTQSQKKQGAKQPQRVSDLNYKDIPKGKGAKSSQA